MNKKILSILIVIGVVVIFNVLYNQIFSPQGEEGQKVVEIEIIVEKEDIHERHKYNTEHEFLYGLLREKEQEMGVSFQTYDFGTMVTGMMDYEAQTQKNEYFHMMIDEEDATSGPDEIPLFDGKIYRFELRNY